MTRGEASDRWYRVNVTLPEGPSWISYYGADKEEAKAAILGVLELHPDAEIVLELETR